MWRTIASGFTFLVLLNVVFCKVFDKLCIRQASTDGDEMLNKKAQPKMERVKWTIRINAQNPYAYKEITAIDECYHGLYVDVLIEAAGAYNVDLNVLSYLNTGNKTAAAAMVEELGKGTTQVGVDNPVQTPERVSNRSSYKVVSMFQDSDLSVLVHKKYLHLSGDTAGTFSVFAGFTAALPASLWILYFCSMMLWSAFSAAEQLCKQERKKISRGGISGLIREYGSSLFDTLGLTLGQGQDRTPRTLSNLMGGFLFYFFTGTFLSIYSARLTSSMLGAQSVAPFTTIEEFAASDFRLIVRESSTSNSIQNHTLWKYRQFATRMTILRAYENPSDFEKTAFEVAANGKYGVLIDYLRTLQLCDDPSFSMRIAIRKFYSLPIGRFLVGKASPLRSKLEHTVDQMVQHGVSEHFLRSRGFTAEHILSKQRHRDRTEFTTSTTGTTSIVELRSEFMLSLLGLGSAVCFFALEFLLQRFKRCTMGYLRLIAH